MAESEDRALPRRRLVAGHTYIDLNHPERGPFVATGNEEVPWDSDVLDQEEIDESTWESMTAEGWGASQPGAGDRGPDQGAFGSEDDPRADVINSTPPGVGKEFTPVESEEEKPRR